MFEIIHEFKLYDLLLIHVYDYYNNVMIREIFGMKRHYIKKTPSTFVTSKYLVLDTYQNKVRFLNVTPVS